ncbi:MAG TPA: tripartite tricarboxylate transporter TctB family protein [Chloroflexota bacterium]|nr:tripartite tricarboxylate transporter TctB family protein [Chloroflexota bacterium]
MSRLLPYLVLLAATLLLLADSLRIRSTLSASDLGAAFWPRTILVLLLLCTLVRLIQMARVGAVSGAAEPANLGKVAVALGLVVAYVWLSSVVGFALATFGYLLVMAGALGYQRRAVSVGVALLTTLALLYVFVRFVYVPLPLGGGIWESVNVALFRMLGLY